MDYYFRRVVFISLILATVFVTICEPKRVRRQGWFGTKAPNATCLFDQCRTPEHCYNGGTCILDKTTCLAFCSCAKGYTGYRCMMQIPEEHSSVYSESTALTSTSHDYGDITTTPSLTIGPPGDHTCFPDMHCEHGHCESTLGFSRCICNQHWTGTSCNTLICNPFCAKSEVCQMVNNVPTCVQASPNILSMQNVKLRPKSERVCVQTFECIHGYCETSDSSFRCVCDVNWIGLFCDRFKCPTFCLPEYDCIFVNDTYQCVKEDNAEQTTVIYPDEANENVTMTANDGFDACSQSYVKRPEHERSCYDKTCKYGRCDIEGLTFMCLCDQNATGRECEVRCCKECGDHGICTVNSVGESECACNHDKVYGEFCNLTKYELDLDYFTERASNNTGSSGRKVGSWVLWLLGISLLVFFLLVFILIVVPYFLWRRKVAWIMEIVYLFQPYENSAFSYSDTRPWDVFIWSNAADEDEIEIGDGVESRLTENMGFSVYPVVKNTYPWKEWQDTILKAIQSSKRILIILTPKFVKNEWTRLDASIVKDLISNNKHRVIFIIVKDFSRTSNIMDISLRDLMKLTVQIRLPDEQEGKERKMFWKRMKFLLPKLKKKSDLLHTNHIELSTQNNGNERIIEQNSVV